MRVVIPVGSLHIGGGCKVLVQIANALADRGHDTEVVCPQGEPVAYELRAKLTFVPYLAPQYIPDGDIVLTNFYTTFRPSFEAWPEHCVRLSLGFEPYWVSDREGALWTYAQGVPIISISHWLDEVIYSHVGQRSHVVNVGVDPQIFHPGARMERRSGRRRRILYIARDPQMGYELKGYNDFVAAMQIVASQYEGKCKVYMICPERILPLPGIHHRAVRPRDDEEMAHLYRASDVFVSTSWFEGFAIPPLEAMACGTPVVTTDSGGVLDFCTHGSTAYVVPPKDPALIAQGILAVLTSGKLAAALRAGGLERAAHLTSEQFEKNIVELLEHLANSR